MSIIKPLPAWALINRFPAFYDHESLTAVEQTARLYGKVNELIEAYNKYVTEINSSLVEFEAQHDKDINCFIKTIIRLTDDYISTVDMKIDHQNRAIAEYEAAFTENVIQTTQGIIEELKANGELDAALLEAVDGLNTRFTTLTEEWETMKGQLQQTQADLESDFYDYREELNAKHTDDMEELRTVATEWRNTQGTVLAEASNGVQFADGEYLGNISDYAIVGVKLWAGVPTEYYYCICKVDYNTSTEQYHITGLGTTTLAPFNNLGITMCGVDMYADANGDLITETCYWYRIANSDAVYLNAGEIYPIRIDGLVLNNDIQ